MLFIIRTDESYNVKCRDTGAEFIFTDIIKHQR